MSIWNKLINRKPADSQAITKDRTSGKSIADNVILPVDELLQPYVSILDKIYSSCSVSQKYYDEYHLATIKNAAKHLAIYPASQGHHHAHKNGLLKHSLEVALYAVRLSRGQIFNPSGDETLVSQERDAFQYTVLCAALLHDIGKSVTDYILYCRTENDDAYRQHSNIFCAPPEWSNYQINYNRRDSKNVYEKNSHNLVASAFIDKVIPAKAIRWILGQSPELFIQFLHTISGDYERGGLIADAVKKADMISVRDNTRAELKTEQTPLPELLKTAMIEMAINSKAHGIKLNEGIAQIRVLNDKVYFVDSEAIRFMSGYVKKTFKRNVPSSEVVIRAELVQNGVILEAPSGDSMWWCKFKTSRGLIKEIPYLVMSREVVDPNKELPDYPGEVQYSPKTSGQEVKPSEHPDAKVDTETGEIYVETDEPESVVKRRTSAGSGVKVATSQEPPAPHTSADQGVSNKPSAPSGNKKRPAKGMNMAKLQQPKQAQPSPKEKPQASQAKQGGAAGRDKPPVGNNSKKKKSGKQPSKQLASVFTGIEKLASAPKPNQKKASNQPKNAPDNNSQAEKPSVEAAKSKSNVSQPKGPKSGTQESREAKSVGKTEPKKPAEPTEITIEKSAQEPTPKPVPTLNPDATSDKKTPKETGKPEDLGILKLGKSRRESSKIRTYDDVVKKKILPKLQSMLDTGALTFNRKDSPVHFTELGIMLVYPACFRLLSYNLGEDEDDLRHAISDCQLTYREGKTTRFAVEFQGPLKTGTVHGYIVQAPFVKYKGNTVSPNPAISKIYRDETLSETLNESEQDQ